MFYQSCCENLAPFEFDAAYGWCFACRLSKSHVLVSGIKGTVAEVAVTLQFSSI